MIDGGAEKLEQEFMSYLVARPHTMLAELAQHFHLSERSASYWLGCLIRSGRVRVGRIEGQPRPDAAGASILEEVPVDRESLCRPEAVLEVCGEAESA
jgi:hypothetical protein